MTGRALTHRDQTWRAQTWRAQTHRDQTWRTPTSRTKTLRVALGTLALISTLAACGGSGSSRAGSSASPRTAMTSAATPAAPAATGSTATGPTPTGGPASASPDPAAIAGITKAYETFFAPDSSAAQVQAVIQNGARFTDAINSGGGSQYSGKSGVKIRTISLRSSKIATVTFDVTINGVVFLPGASGYAVDDGGTWKMAATTFCQLVSLASTPPKVCSDPSATALPTA